MDHSHKDSGSIGSRDGVEERGTVLVRGFYKAGTKMTPRFRDGIGVPGSRNGTLDPDFCDYAMDCLPTMHNKGGVETYKLLLSL